MHDGLAEPMAKGTIGRRILAAGPSEIEQGLIG